MQCIRKGIKNFRCRTQTKRHHGVHTHQPLQWHCLEYSVMWVHQYAASISVLASIAPLPAAATTSSTVVYTNEQMSKYIPSSMLLAGELNGSVISQKLACVTAFQNHPESTAVQLWQLLQVPKRPELTSQFPLLLQVIRHHLCVEPC